MHFLSRLPTRFLDVTFLAALAFSAGCGSSSSLATGPTPVKCRVTLAAASGAIDSGGGTSAVTVTTQPECAWTASAEAPWITELSPESGQGDGEVRFRVTANPAAAARAGEVIVNDARARVDQAAAACRFTLGDLDAAFGDGSTSRTVTITTLTGCTWSVSADVPWITPTPASGTGTGTITVTVAANGGGQRSGAVTVAGQTLAITQNGIAPQTCEVSATPLAQTLTATGGAGTPIAITTPAACAWTAVASDPWIVLTATSGTGPGAVTFTVTPNGVNPRGGAIRINNATVTISQAGTPSCAATIAPLSQSIAAAGGAGVPIAVSTSSGCRWSATSHVAWVTIVSGETGTGNGTAQYVVAANTGSERTGVISVAGQTFTITQAAAPTPPPTGPAPPTPPPPSCTFALANSSQSIGAAGGDGTAIGVTAPAGCAWTASSNASWLSITNGASGSGNGSVTFTAAANPSGARTGTMTIAGNTYTVIQAAGCSFAISPSSQSASSIGGRGGPVSVTTTSGCTWTAGSNVQWITVTFGASGSGNGSVGFDVAANTGAARTGTLTIADATFTVSQAAASTCTYSVNPTSFSFDSKESKKDDGTVTITTQGGCAWTASVASGGSFISLTSAASGSGDGTVSFSVTRNDGAAPRSGSLTIAGHTIAIIQSAKD